MLAIASQIVGNSRPMFKAPTLIAAVIPTFLKRQPMHRFLLQADDVRRLGKFCTSWTLALLFLLDVAIPKATGFMTENGFDALATALGNNLPDGSGVVGCQGGPC